VKPPIGFALATFNRPEQTLLLCKRLNAMFAAPPIAIHHDYSQCQMDQSQFPENVHFVESWTSTEWGSIGVVRAFLLSLGLLYEAGDAQWGDPDWVVTLSSTDYPIQTAEQILDDLGSTSFDAFMDLRPIRDTGSAYRNKAPGGYPFRQPGFIEGAYRRYVAIPLFPVHLARQYRIPVEQYCLKWKWLIQLMTPFDESFQCYAGDAWFTARRQVAHAILKDDDRQRKLLRHYASRSTPEESFWHTIVANTSGFQIAPENLRYTDWKGTFAHPRLLGRQNFSALLASNCHFARKFPFEPEMMTELDRAVEAKSAQTGATSTDLCGLDHHSS
jgi:hypothetical protein